MSNPAGQLSQRLKLLRFVQVRDRGLALRHGLLDAALKSFVEFAQLYLGAPTGRHVLEDDRHFAARDRLHPESRQLQMAPRGDQLPFEPDRNAGRQNVAVHLNPAVRFVRHHITNFFADDARYSSVPLVRGISLDMNVIAQWPLRPIQELYDAEAFVHRFEQRPISCLAVSESDEACTRFILTHPPAQSRPRKAYQRSRMKRALKECNVAQQFQVPPGRRIALQPPAPARQQDEREIRPFLLILDPRR